MASRIHLDSSDGICIFRMDRPKANAIDISFAEELDETLAGLETNPEIRALVVTGTGASFSAGLDLKAIPSYTVEEQDRLINSLNALLLRLYGFPRPVVAAANGHAIAGGMILLLACDYRVGIDDPGARFGLTEAQVGVAFPLGAKEIVLTEVPDGGARRMMLTGWARGADHALRDGSLDELQPASALLDRAVEVATQMAALPARSFAAIKRQIRGPALDRIRVAVETKSDPLLGNWLSSEAPETAAKLLGKD